MKGTTFNKHGAIVLLFQKSHLSMQTQRTKDYRNRTLIAFI